MGDAQLPRPDPPSGPPPAVATPSLLDKIINDGKMAREESQRDYAGKLISAFAGEVVDSKMKVTEDTRTSITEHIAAIDKKIQDQLNLILHDQSFKQVEASWRGLQYLVKGAETGTDLKLRLLNVTKKEIADDLNKVLSFEQSNLFKRIYEDEYGTFGGHPFSCLIGDFEFGRNQTDMTTLTNISKVAAAAHAPFIAAAGPELFDWGSFTEMTGPRDLAKGFETEEMAKWKGFRESEDSRYVALVLPHVLMRAPYGKDSVPVEEFAFEEDVDGADHEKYLWGNASYALAERIAAAFSRYHWCAAIRGVEGGGLVTALPTHTFPTAGGDKAMKCPTEIAITDRREKELSDLGFIALCHCKGTDVACFFGGQTVNRPKQYITKEANANARLSSMLPYVMAASRFAHYLKSIMRDKIGSFSSKDSVQKYLNTWIAQYVLLRDDAPQEVKAAFPLREARVDVVDVPGKPGAYRAVAFLRPHFQLDELSVSIRLVADLPAPAAA